MPSATKIGYTYDEIDGLGPQVAPAIAASTVAVANPFAFPCFVRVKGGTVTVVSVGGNTYATATNALVLVKEGESITLTYSAAPTWDWTAIPGK